MTNGKLGPPTDTTSAIFEAAEFLSRNQDGSLDLADRGGTTNDEIVERALQSALGGPTTTADPAGFAAALGRTTTTEQVDGQTRTVYRRPTGAGPVLPDALGALTGAQATLYSQAQAARTQIVELVDRLKPLALTPDPDAVNDLRSLLKSLVDGVAEELGQPGGPTVPRVDHLLAELVGRDVDGLPAPVDPANLDGVLLRLRDAFGMERGEISSLEDERVFTDFNALVGDISALRTSWIQDRDFLDPLIGEPFLGTQLVQIERALEVVGQAVEEAYAALDRAQVEQTERDVSRVPVGPGGRTVSLGSALAWVGDFARSGRERLKQGGKDGIGSVAVEAATLDDLLGKLVANLPSTGSSTFTLTGIGSQPVRAALTALARNVKAVRDLAVIIRRPKLTLASVELELAEFVDADTSTPAPVTQRRTLTLRGRGFGQDTSVDLFNPDSTLIAPSSFTKLLIDDEEIAVAVPAELSIARITVTNDDGSTDAVELQRPPAAPLALDSVRIGEAEVATGSGLSAVQPRQTLTLIGGGFRETTEVDLFAAGSAIPAGSFETLLVSDRRIEVILDSDAVLSRIQVRDGLVTDRLDLVRLVPAPQPVSLSMAFLGDPAVFADGLHSEGTPVRILALVGSEFSSGTTPTVTAQGSSDPLDLAGWTVMDEHMLLVAVSDVRVDPPWIIHVENPDGSDDTLVLEGPPYNQTSSAKSRKKGP
jgi:hypothetical protein